MTIRFTNAVLLDGTTENRREGCDVVVAGGRIVEVSDKPVRTDVAETIDLAGRTLMPGLIDAHIHAIAVEVNLAKLAEMPPTLVAAKAARILNGMLKRGFTTVRDAGGADFGLAEAVATGLIEGPRLFIAGKALSQTGGHGDMRARTMEIVACACCQSGTALSRIVDGVDACRQAARDELRKGANQIKIMASGGVASPTDPIWNLQYSEGEVRAIVEEARAWRTYVMAHAYTPEAIRRSIDFGVRSIEHGNLIDRATAEHVAAQNAYVVPTLVTYEALEKFGKTMGFPDVSLAKLAEVRAAGLESLDHLRSAGVNVGFGTDLLGAMHEHQSREFSIRAEALTPFEVIRSATAVNAALLNMTGQIGVIAPGAFADLIVVDGDPLQDLSLLEGQGARLPIIMKEGSFYKREI